MDSKNNGNVAGIRTRRRRPRHDPSSPDQSHHIASVTTPSAIEKPPIGSMEAASVALSLPDLTSSPVLHNPRQSAAQKGRHQQHSRYHHHRFVQWTLFLCAISVPIILYAKSNAEFTNNSLLFLSGSSSSRTNSRSLRLPYLMRETSDGVDDGNMGGWLVSPGRRVLPEMMEEPNAGLADYGGLVFLSLRASRTFQRTIRQHDITLYNGEKKLQMDIMNEEYISKRHWFDDELEDKEQECRRPSWEKLHFPNCLAFHEIDLSRNYDATLAQRSGDSQAGDSFYLR